MFDFYLIYNKMNELIDIVKAPDNAYEYEVAKAYGLLHGCNVDAYRRSPEEINQKMFVSSIDSVQPN